MTHITRDDILKIASLSGLSLTESEVTKLTYDLENIFDSVEKLTSAALAVTPPTFSDYLAATNSWNPAVARLCTVYRDDVAHRTDAAPLRADGPECAENFFVVPSIIER